MLSTVLIVVVSKNVMRIVGINFILHFVTSFLFCHVCFISVSCVTQRKVDCVRSVSSQHLLPSVPERL